MTEYTPARALELMIRMADLMQHTNCPDPEVCSCGMNQLLGELKDFCRAEAKVLCMDLAEANFAAAGARKLSIFFTCAPREYFGPRMYSEDLKPPDSSFYRRADHGCALTVCPNGKRLVKILDNRANLPEPILSI